MRKMLPALFLMCTLGSCVTLFNGPSTSLNVRIPDNAKVVYTNECGSTDSVSPDINNMARLIVRRNNKQLPLTVVSDTGSFSFAVKPTMSWLFWANVYPLYGLGFLVSYLHQLDLQLQILGKCKNVSSNTYDPFLLVICL